MKPVLLGIDIGTSGCKITVVDPEGRILDEGFGAYQTRHPQPGWSEQDPEDWWRVTCEVLRTLSARRTDEIAAIGLDGTTHNAVLTDGAFRPLRPAIMWTDQRSAPEAAALPKERILQITYQTPSSTWTLPQIRWLQAHQPEVPARTAHVFFTKDWVRHHLTGTWETDHIEAQGSLLYDIHRRTWSEELCGLAGLPVACLPPLVEPTTVVGSVTPQAAAATGLKTGTPVIAGSSDTAVEDYAAGAIRPGQVVLKLATAGNVNVITAAPHPNPRTLTYSHVVPGLWYTALGTNTAASALRWFRDTFCGAETSYALLDEMAAAAPPGSDGLFFHPYLLGERAPYWDPNLRGSFTGATMRHGKAHFVRALLEGVAWSLCDCFRAVGEMRLPADEVRLIGGGSRSTLWSQIVADIFARPVVRPAGCDASFGAALLAGIGIRLFADELDAVRRCTRVRDTVTPDARAAGIYARLFPLYCRIHDQMAGVYAALAEANQETACP